MYDRDTVELALLALEEGMAEREAAELCGASLTSVRRWARQGPPTRPRGRAARPPRPPARMYPPDAKEGPLNEAERVAYEAAMTENMLLRAVLDDLKGEGSHPASMSNRRKCELGERLRAATGRPLREITAFLRISRSLLALPQNQPNAPLYPAGGAPGSRPGALPHFGRPRYLGPPPRARSTAG